MEDTDENSVWTLDSIEEDSSPSISTASSPSKASSSQSAPFVVPIYPEVSPVVIRPLNPNVAAPKTHITSQISAQIASEIAARRSKLYKQALQRISPEKEASPGKETNFDEDNRQTENQSLESMDCSELLRFASNVTYFDDHKYYSVQNPKIHRPTSQQKLSKMVHRQSFPMKGYFSY